MWVVEVVVESARTNWKLETTFITDDQAWEKYWNFHVGLYRVGSTKLWIPIDFFFCIPCIFENLSWAIERDSQKMYTTMGVHAFADAEARGHLHLHSNETVSQPKLRYQKLLPSRFAMHSWASPPSLRPAPLCWLSPRPWPSPRTCSTLPACSAPWSPSRRCCRWGNLFATLTTNLFESAVLY